jgi:hypothetical protein
MSIHHIDMDNVGPGLVNRPDFITQGSKISRKDRRGYQYPSHLTFLFDVS